MRNSVSPPSIGPFSACLTPHGFLIHNSEEGPISANRQTGQRFRQELVKIRGNVVGQGVSEQGPGGGPSFLTLHHTTGNGPRVMVKQPVSRGIPGFLRATFSVIITEFNCGRSAGTIAGWSVWEGHDQHSNPQSDHRDDSGGEDTPCIPTGSLGIHRASRVSRPLGFLLHEPFDFPVRMKT